MTCGFVFTSGAGMSTFGPMNGWISVVYRLVRFCTSFCESSFGLTSTPPFAPPYGSPTTAHFQVIHIARAFTSFSVTS